MNNEPLEVCSKCGCRDLFIRKNFPQKIGLSFVIIAAVAFLFLASRRETFWIGALILTIAAAIDAVIYLFVCKITVCYRCRAEFPDRINPKHTGFDLATAEKYRR